MRLYVMRHGPAEDHARTGRDADRALTAAGRAVVERAAAALRASRQAALGQILSSPLVRAQQTAAIVGARVAPSVAIEVRDELSPGGSSYPLIRELAERGEDALLVAHQPDVEYLVRAIVTAATTGEHTLHGFRTAMIVALDSIGSDGWRIEAILDPHQNA